MLDVVKPLRMAGFYKGLEHFSDEDILEWAALIKEERFKKTLLEKELGWYFYTAENIFEGIHYDLGKRVPANEA